jgi:hypothetical protein
VLWEPSRRREAHRGAVEERGECLTIPTSVVEPSEGGPSFSQHRAGPRDGRLALDDDHTRTAVQGRAFTEPPPGLDQLRVSPVELRLSLVHPHPRCCNPRPRCCNVPLGRSRAAIRPRLTLLPRHFGRQPRLAPRAGVR